MRTCLALVVVLMACGPKKEEIPETPPEPEKTTALPPKPLPPKPQPARDVGSCQLTATGAVTAEQTTPGGRSATNVSYWFKEEERKNMMGVDGFVVNCNGPDIRFSLIPGGGNKDGMPFTPKTYEFKKGGPRDANVMVGFGKSALTNPTGTVDITAFDARHIAGTIDLTGKLLPGGGEVKLTGTFDLGCPGFSACEP